MFEIRIEPSADEPSPEPVLACHVARCTSPATHRPVLYISLVGSAHVSRVALPARVCERHRDAFSEHFLTPERRAQMESALRSRGRETPDWARTRVEFVTT